MRLYYDNQTVVYIAENYIFHERTKHIEVDRYLICQKIEENIVQARHLSSSHQLANLLTKSIKKIRVNFIRDKLDMYDVYAPV